MTIFKAIAAWVRRAFEGTDWVVETFSFDGSIERAIFIGRRAEESARRFYESERDRDGRGWAAVRLVSPSDSWTVAGYGFTTAAESSQARGRR